MTWHPSPLERDRGRGLRTNWQTFVTIRQLNLQFLVFLGVLYLLLLPLLIALATSLVINLHPVFGAYAKGDRLARIRRSANSEKGVFRYPVPTKVSTSFDITKFPDFFRKGDTTPDRPLPTLSLNAADYPRLSPDELRVTWLGHSILLIEIGGQRILIDPVLSPVPSPFSFAGNPAFAMTYDYRVEDLPQIDLVLLSHDHYDHLDYPTILKLKDRVPRFVVSLGVGAHLERWGITPEKITELDWWATGEVANLAVTSTPARHFSGRRFRRNRALWGGFALRYGERNVLYAGDSGHGPHFADIGERLGPFNLAFLECGQYNEMWHQIHAMPEELPRAWKEVNADLMMPIHWGRFKLAMHGWTEPVERLLAATPEEDRGRLLTPRIGERFDPLVGELPTERWWRSKYT